MVTGHKNGLQKYTFYTWKRKDLHPMYTNECRKENSLKLLEASIDLVQIIEGKDLIMNQIKPRAREVYSKCLRIVQY